MDDIETTEEITEEKPKKKRVRKPKVYKYVGRGQIHTSIGRFCEGDVIEGLPEDEVTKDMVLI